MTRSTGIPTWIDLGTTDLEGVKPFYVELFGWNFEDAGEQFGHYNMITKEGGLVGGAMDLNHLPGAAPDNQPSTWDVFLAVDDVEKRHALALQQGASSLFGPSEVGPAGRCATVADPTGATVAMWQAGDTEGYSFTGRPGTAIWFELVTTDMAAASAFYTEVFEFNHVAMDDDYATNGPVDEATSGMMRSEDGASYWQITVAVSDIAAALDRTTELGGQLVKVPADSPWGPFATIADPQGARLLVMQPPANAS